MSISSHMDDKASSMRLVYDRINTNIRGLESIGIKSDQYGSLLIPVIMSKLPSEIRLIIARKSEHDVWKIDDLMTTILSEVEAREKSANELKQQMKENRSFQIIVVQTNTEIITQVPRQRCIVARETIRIIQIKFDVLIVMISISPLHAKR